MIDMDEVTRFTLDEADLLPRIGVHQNTFEYDTATGTRLERHIGEVTPQHVVAGIAAVVVGISPRRSERLAGVTRLRRAPLDEQGLQDDGGETGLSCDGILGLSDREEGRADEERAEQDGEQKG